MASKTHRFLKSPLRVMLTGQFLASVATGAALACGVLVTGRAATAGSGGLSGVLESLGSSIHFPATGAGGMTLLWAMTLPLLLLFVLSLAMGLVYGKWGLPGHLQGRAVYFVPPLAVVYFVAGSLALHAIAAEGNFGQSAARAGELLGSPAGLTLLGIYAALSTSAVGLGWAISLAVTLWQRRRGKWETIGPAEAVQ